MGVDGRVVECCLEPPLVGQKVGWQLQFHQDDDGVCTDADEAVQLLHVVAVPLQDWDGPTLDRRPVRLRTQGGADLYWEAERPVAGHALLGTITISISRHGEAPGEVPPVEARVRRVRLTHTSYEEVPPGSHSWAAVRPVDVRHEDVRAAPTWFPDTDLSHSPVRLADQVLVDLELVAPGR